MSLRQQQAPKDHEAVQISLRTALILMLFTAAFTTLIAFAYLPTRDTIAASANGRLIQNTQRQLR